MASWDFPLLSSLFGKRTHYEVKDISQIIEPLEKFYIGPYEIDLRKNEKLYNIIKSMEEHEYMTRLYRYPPDMARAVIRLARELAIIYLNKLYTYAVALGARPTKELIEQRAPDIFYFFERTLLERHPIVYDLEKMF